MFYATQEARVPVTSFTGVSQKVRLPLLWGGVNGSKKITRICLDNSALFFHILSKLVQALFITYDEISQALAVGDVLLPKPFLNLGFDDVVRWKPPEGSNSTKQAWPVYPRYSATV
jgi:hypothetical protein